MLPVECTGEEKTSCADCGEHMDLGVYESGSGFYVGFWCPNCGPYSRKSKYFDKRQHAEKRLRWLLGAS